MRKTSTRMAWLAVGLLFAPVVASAQEGGEPQLTPELRAMRAERQADRAKKRAERAQTEAKAVVDRLREGEKKSPEVVRLFGEVTRKADEASQYFDDAKEATGRVPSETIRETLERAFEDAREAQEGARLAKAKAKTDVDTAEHALATAQRAEGEAQKELDEAKAASNAAPQNESLKEMQRRAEGTLDGAKRMVTEKEADLIRQQTHAMDAEKALVKANSATPGAAEPLKRVFAAVREAEQATYDAEAAAAAAEEALKALLALEDKVSGGAPQLTPELRALRAERQADRAKTQAARAQKEAKTFVDRLREGEKKKTEVVRLIGEVNRKADEASQQFADAKEAAGRVPSEMIRESLERELETKKEAEALEDAKLTAQKANVDAAQRALRIAQAAEIVAKQALDAADAALRAASPKTKKNLTAQQKKAQVALGMAQAMVMGAAESLTSQQATATSAEKALNEAHSAVAKAKVRVTRAVHEGLAAAQEAERATQKAEAAATEAEDALKVLLAQPLPPEDKASDDASLSQLYPNSSEWPRDCRNLPPPELDDNYWRIVRSARRGSAKRWDRRQVFTVIYHGDTGTFERRLNYTYPWSIVRVCVSDQDYRLRYRLATASIEFKAPSPDILERFKEESALAGKPEVKDRGKGASDKTQLQDPETVIADNLTKLHDAFSLIEGEDKNKAAEKVLASIEARLSEIKEALDKLVNKAPAAPDSLKEKIYQQQRAIAEIDHVMREMTGDVPILAARARELHQKLKDQWDALVEVATGRPQRRVDTAILRARLGQDEELLKELLSKLEEERTKYEGAQKEHPNSNLQKALDLLNKTKASAQQAQDKLDARKRELETLAGEDRDDLPALRDALTVAGSLQNHLALVTHNVFYVLIEKDRQYDIILEKDRLRLVQRDLIQTHPGPAETDGKPAGQDTGNNKTTRSSEAPAVTPTPQKIAALEYEPLGGQGAKVTLQVRSLTYFRLNLGIVYSTLRQGQFTLTQNDTGSQVITRRGDQIILPLILLSHYWCGVDLREIQPYHRFRECGWKNLLPTFTVGIPLSRNPIENLFVGTLWQPVPGLAFTAGVHLGRTWVLQRGYVEGQPPPPPLGDQTFDITSVQDQRLRLGYFLGIAITDSIFVKAVSALAGLNN
jgi:hypothetical protein